MKPRIFIGSSVEGLNVAYSIQQNLTFDADVTVWDQGVFELSKTTIESLIDMLGKSDFGIFVFNKDDIVRMRQKTENVVRDNVLFEFGLFIGRLGRERVFFVIPNRTNLRLPSDLLGITPGKYDPDREDNSIQAATGPVCHQIRILIKNLGTLNTVDETSKEPEHKEATLEENDWTDYFIKKEFSKAIDVLEKIANDLTEPDDILDNKIWTAYCKLKLDETKGVELLDDVLERNKDNIKAHKGIARVYFWSDYLDKAIQILNQAITQFPTNQDLKKNLAICYKNAEGDEKALEYLLSMSPEENHLLALEIADIYMNQKLLDKSRELVHKVYLKWPKNEDIRYKYSRIAMDLNLQNIALYFLNSLTQDYPNDSTYWGYLGNCYLALELYDLALVSYRKANELSKEKEEWIISNIGNALKNKGFYTESIQYFEKGIELNKNSNYAHDRLATTIKSKEEEAQKSLSFIKEGRKELKIYNLNGGELKD